MVAFMRTSNRARSSLDDAAGRQGKLVELRDHPREILLIGLNHRGVEVALRERFALDSADCTNLLHKLLEQYPDTSHGIIEAVAYSTCNRVEVAAAVVPECAEQAVSYIEKPSCKTRCDAGKGADAFALSA